MKQPLTNKSKIPHKKSQYSSVIITLLILVTLTLNIFLITSFITKFKFQLLENKIYSLANLPKYPQKKIMFRKIPNKPRGVYYQYKNGCVLYSLINAGYLDESDIPTSMKIYKDHLYTKDEKTQAVFLRKLLSLIDLAQLWINLGGISPYKNPDGSVKDLNAVKKEAFNLLKKYVYSKNEDRKIEDIKPAFNIVKAHDRFVMAMGKLPIELLNLSQCEFASKLSKLNLKNAIDKGFIKENDTIMCLKHYVLFNGIKNINGKKVYVFTDSQIDLLYKMRPQYGEGAEVNLNKGLIMVNERGTLINALDGDIPVGISRIIFK